MSSGLDQYALWLQSPLGLVQAFAGLVIGVCAAAMGGAVVFSFVAFGGRRDVRQRRPSVVATATMTGFAAVFAALVALRVGALAAPAAVRAAAVGAGLVLVVGGCLLNLAGRMALGTNWADQVTLYADQGLVTEGAFRFARHPLYASLILFFYGVSLVTLNGAAFLANTAVFVPFMAYRARQEETVLAKQFPAYAGYQARVALFGVGWRKGGWSCSSPRNR
jgi:protein-S-isoprenylcysteine O-methyltransferase Ste14